MGSGTSDAQQRGRFEQLGCREAGWSLKFCKGSDAGRNFQFPACHQMISTTSGRMAGQSKRPRPETGELLWWEDLLLLLLELIAPSGLAKAGRGPATAVSFHRLFTGANDRVTSRCNGQGFLQQCTGPSQDGTCQQAQQPNQASRPAATHHAEQHSASRLLFVW